MDDRTCSVPGCERPTRGGNAELCKAHYFRVRRTGQVGSAEIAPQEPAQAAVLVDGCERTAFSTGWRDVRDAPPPHQDQRRTGHRPAEQGTARLGNRAWKGDQAGYARPTIESGRPR
jgi:hypothetical protein